MNCSLQNSAPGSPAVHPSSFPQPSPCPTDMRCSSKSPKNSAFGFLGATQGANIPCGKCPQRGHCFHLCFHRWFWVKSSPSVVFYIILCGLFFLSPYMPHSWEMWEIGRMLNGIRTRLTQVGIIFTDEPLGQKLHGQSCRRWKRQVRPVSPRQVPGALPCPSHLTCRPLCTPGWPRCTRGGDSGPAARCWLGVCRTSRTSSVLRERAGGRGAPAAVSDGDLLTGSWLRRRAQQHQGVRSPLFHPHPGARLAAILIPQWWPASHPKRRSPQPSAHPRKRRETQLPTLKPRAGGDAGLSVSAGPGQQRSLHGRGCDE